MRRSCGCALIATAIVAACGRAQPVLDQGNPIAALFSGQAEWIDMSYAYDEDTIFWPTARVFEFEIVEAGTSDAGYYYAANSFCTAEHGGTHLDAPIHFGEGRQTVAEIPLDRLVGPAVVVDVSAAAEARPEYLVVPDDFEAWEGEHGRILDGAIVLVRTGWGARAGSRPLLGDHPDGRCGRPGASFPRSSSGGRPVAGGKSQDRCGGDRYGEHWRRRGTAPVGSIRRPTLGPDPPGAGCRGSPGVRECGGARQTATNRRLRGRAADEDRARERRPDPDRGGYSGPGGVGKGEGSEEGK